MSSIQGLPTRGSDITILIAKVHLHPLCSLVEFWGKFSQEKTSDYESLARDIQSPGKTFQELEGNPGDECLVQIDGTWYRSRIVSRNGSKYSVFLIDKGTSCNTTTNNLAWGKKKHFHLPPEVEFCVLANVLPLSPENRWSPVALEFLRSLAGKSVKAHVQDVLVPHRTFVLHIPCISKQMYEMGIAKKLSPDMFQNFVLMSLHSQGGAEVSQETQQTSDRPGTRLHKTELFMYPELPAGTVETVIVTDVTNPQRIFCQLKVFSQELKKLSEQITQCCEGRMTNCIVGPEMIGFPCAARGSDGRWYRSVLQQVLPTNKVVEVLNVDYGTKHFVQVEHVRPLATEFFRLPVVTYVCSLHGIIDKGVGWTSSQIEYLRTLVLYKTVIAKFEYQSISEGVHYVTLYGEENANINNLFGSKLSCSLECEKSLGEYAIPNTAHSRRHQSQQDKNQRKVLTPGQAAAEKEGIGRVKKLPAEDLSLNSSHVAVVQHVSDPTEFWIQTENYAKELEELLDNIHHLYKESANKDVVKNPTVGLYCAAKSEDGDFYRATVAEVGEKQIKVFFVDYGNTEVVDRNNIRTLPGKFKQLPCLGLKCSLAGVRPKDGKWSKSACEFFIRAVTDKTLNVHVSAKYDEGYVVQLTDPEVQGEKDLAALMCSADLAERVETQRPPKAKMTIQPAILPTTQLPDGRFSGVLGENGISRQALNTVGPVSNEGRTPTFKEQMFPIGSVLDVSVSYIESPNDFWCQLVQNAGHLKLLMHEIQARYAGSEFQPLVETTCIARHPDNGMWYRVLVIHKYETPHVDVLFVDYGQTEMVSLYELRRICPEFLTLHGQAFRCSLLNPVDPTAATNEWNDEATTRFQSFVKNAASDLVILKCTVYAVMYSEQKIVFNIVDLETPFESIATSMANLVKSAPPKVRAGPSFLFDTYYYSTHNVKTGTEEQVTVTCVNSVSQFYCHLERNADAIQDLKTKVSNLCQQLEKIKLPVVFGTLCFAKYTDGQWYRGQIKATKPALLVHFVDYGDTLQVEKSDLLPVPREANDIMSVPVQAVVCGLSDIPADVPSEVNCWFETSATECKFRALIVAREPDGKLLVELYHGNSQVNSKIRKTFQIELHTKKQVVSQGWKGPVASENHAQKNPDVVPKQSAEMVGHTPNTKKNVPAPKAVHQMRDADMTHQSEPKPLRRVGGNGQRVKAAPLELYKPPHQRQSCESKPSSTANGSEPPGTCIKPGKEYQPTQTEKLIKSKSPGTERQTPSDAGRLPKLADLPSKYLTSDLEADVYVSHCNSPLSFYVQLVREEDELFSLAEKLNAPDSIPESDSVKDVHPGDLIQAEFAEDSSWYRAVVREKHSTTALVEFVDFGNTAVISVSKMSRLNEHFLQIPMYSTHCMLSDAVTLGKETVLGPDVTAAFRDAIGGNGEKVLKCKFLRQSGSVWQVSLENEGVNVTCEVPTRRSTDGSDIDATKLEQVPENSQTSLQSSCSLCYHQQEFSEGQNIEVYITAISDAQTFWCQPADSEELDKITSSVSEVGDASNYKQIDPSSLSPGSPCIALFAEDNFWYRAQVLDKDGDMLSVLFVDYGNKAQVSVAHVREMPTDLMKTPQQAFLCELEGFDASLGSWDSGAVDELSGLTTDKVLHLTVTKVTNKEGKITCLVQMECEGQIINETLRTWWKSSMTENKPDTVGPTTSYEIPLQCDSSERAPPRDQQESCECPETEIAIAHDHPQRDDSEEQNAGEPVDPQTADDIPEQVQSKSSEETIDKDDEEESASGMDSAGPDASHSPLNENPPEAKGDISTTDLDSLPLDVNTRGMESSSDILIFSDPNEQGDDSEVAILRDIPLRSMTTVKMVPREAGCPGESIDPDIIHRTSEDAKQVQAEFMLPSSELPASDAMTERETEGGCDVPQEEVTCVTTQVKIQSELEPSSSELPASDNLTEQETEPGAAISEEAVLSVTTCIESQTELELPSSDLPATDDLIGQETEAGDAVQKQEMPHVTTQAEIETEFMLAFSELPDAPTEQELESVDVLPKTDVPCATTHVENDLMDEEDNVAHQEDASSATHADTDTAASEPITCTAPLKDSVEELSGSVEEACLIDIYADPYEPSDDSEVAGARDDCLSSATAEEMVQNESLPPSIEHPMEHLTALPSESEPQVCSVCCPDLNHLVEEVTCLVGEISLSDVFRDPQQESETEDSEQLTLPEQEEVFSGGDHEEEMVLSAGDCFEAQLTNITHLCLIINDGSADVLPVEQQPEE